MLDAVGRARLTAAVKTLQVIVLAMVVGALGFLIVGMLIEVERAQSSADRGLSPILSYMAAAFGPVALVASFVAPAALLSVGTARVAAGRPLPGADRSDQPRDDIGQLIQLHAQITIIGCACLEGAALLAGLAYMIEKQIIALVVAAALITFLAARVPTITKLSEWIDERSDKLERIRSAAVK